MNSIKPYLKFISTLILCFIVYCQAPAQLNLCPHVESETNYCKEVDKLILETGRKIIDYKSKNDKESLDSISFYEQSEELLISFKKQLSNINESNYKIVLKYSQNEYTMVDKKYKSILNKIFELVNKKFLKKKKKTNPKQKINSEQKDDTRLLERVTILEEKVSVLQSKDSINELNFGELKEGLATSNNKISEFEKGKEEMSWQDWLLIVGFPIVLLFTFIRGRIGKSASKRQIVKQKKNFLATGKGKISDSDEDVEDALKKLGDKVEALSKKNEKLEDKLKGLGEENQSLKEDVAWLTLKQNQRSKSNDRENAQLIGGTQSAESNNISTPERHPDQIENHRKTNFEAFKGHSEEPSPQFDLSVSPQRRIPREVFFIPDRQEDKTFKVSRATTFEEDLSRFRIEKSDENLYHLSVIIRPDQIDILVGDRMLFLEPFFEILPAEDNTRNIVKNHTPAVLKKDDSGKFWVIEELGKVIFNKV